ncbi:MAG: hypothetical protein WCZ65_08470 [Lysobacteraceae bacterium]
MVDPQSLKIPFWTLFMVCVIQSVGELCLSPIGLLTVTRLAPVRLVASVDNSRFPHLNALSRFGCALRLTGQAHNPLGRP